MADNMMPGHTNGSGNGATPLDSVQPLAGPGPGTDFKAVAIGAAANVEPLTGYFTDPLLQTGNLPGIAISAFNNRALRQGTFVAHSLCQWISNELNVYVPDDGSDINWIAMFQQALNALILAAIPPGPNLGAYLPLAGGTMVGHIYFQPGISTILSNNTWYYGRDTAGQARGLIIKAADNNVYINDGTAQYVIMAGTPLIGNNVAYAGRDTGGGVHGLISMLSDNNVHIGGGSTVICDVNNGGSFWTNGNVVTGNNMFLYCRDSGGNPRQAVGFAPGSNVFQVGPGSAWETHIYGGNGWVYLHSNVNPLGQLWVNGYSYLNGGARSYIPGGNDSFQVYSDYGYYSRTHYIVGGIRDWTCGCLNSGPFGIADESAAAMRFEIDTAGNITSFNSHTIGGNLYVNGGQIVYNGLTVYGSINVASGGASFGNASVYNIWDLHINGGVYIGGLGGIWDEHNGWMAYTHNMHTTGAIQADNYIGTHASMQVDGNFNCSNQISSNTVYTNYCQSNGDFRAGGGMYCGYFLDYGSGQFNDTLVVGNVVRVNGWDANLFMQNGAIWFNGQNGNAPRSFSTHLSSNANGAWAVSDLNQGGLDLFYVWYLGIMLPTNGWAFKQGGGQWGDLSERRFKKNIEDYTQGLEVVRKLRPRSYEFNGEGGTHIDGRRYVGLVVDEMEELMPEMLTKIPDWPTAGDDPTDTVRIALDATALQYALVNAVKMLADRVEQLEGALHARH